MLSRRRLLLAGLVACAGRVAVAQGPAKADPLPPPKRPDAPTGRPLTLGECLAVADGQQPDIRAAVHSLRAAELGLQGLSNLGKIFDRLSPDLPVRRQQAVLGLRVAQAQVDLARQETVYDVTLLYWSFVYARQSEQTAADVVEQLDAYYKVARDILESGVADRQIKLTRQTLYGLEAVIAEVRTLRLRAETGRRQALAALRQAMGVGPEFDFHPAAKELPVMGGSVAEADVVAWALAGRPELAQAAAGAEVFNLEPCAQAQVRVRPQVNTLAAGTDLHARGVPLALRNGQYRPGALAPEMPVSLVGRADDRVARAQEYAARQGVVYDKTVGLVRLEATNAYVEWSAATERVGLARKRFEASRQAVQEAQAAATTRQDPQVLVTAEAVAGRAQADYVEAVFEHVKALAKLERVTAGAIRPAFPGR